MAEKIINKDGDMSSFDYSIKCELLDRGFTNDIESFRVLKENDGMTFVDVIATQENWAKFRKWQNDEILKGNIRLDKNRIENWINIYYGSMARKFIANFSYMNDSFIKEYKDYEKEVKSFYRDWKKYNSNYFAGKKEKPLFWIKTEEFEKKYDVLNSEITKLIVNADEVPEKSYKNDVDCFNTFIAGEMSVKELDGLMIEQLEQSKIKNKEARGEFLTWYAKFPCSEYSARNKVAIYLQCEDAYSSPIVAGYQQYKNMGLQVEKGQEAKIGICYKREKTFYLSKDENGEYKKFVNYDKYSKFAKQTCEEKARNGEYKKITKSYYEWRKCLFTLEQTTVSEKEKPFILQKYSKTIDTPEKNKLFNNLVKICELFDIKLGTLENEIKPIVNNEIQAEDPTFDGKLFALTHNVAHHCLKHDKEDYYPKKFKLSHKMEEIQAQAVAHIVLNSFGVDTQNSSSYKYLDSSANENELLANALNSANAEEFYNTLVMVDELTKKLSGALKMEEITKENLTDLLDYEPDYLQYDEDSNRITIVNAKKYDQQQIEKIKKEVDDVNSKKEMVDELPKTNDVVEEKPKKKKKEKVREHSIELSR